MQSQRKWYSAGFSMLELAIVLVIVGLLTLGVLAGSSLIHQAELRSISTEVEKHITAVKTFYEKYGYYPGDMPNASDFWLDATDCPAGLVPSGCNGDGDQRINDNLPATVAERAEKYRAWQHLVFAGMMEGNFTGLKVPGTTDKADATNSPSSNKSGGLYYLVWDNFFGFFQPPVNMLCFGSMTPNNDPAGIIWSPRDAYQLDKKIDDGLPYDGRMTSNATGGDGNCVISSKYNLPFNATACRSCFDLDIINVNGQ